MGGTSSLRPGIDAVLLGNHVDSSVETTAETRIPGTSARRHARSLLLILLPLCAALAAQVWVAPALSVLPLLALAVAFAAREGGLTGGLGATAAAGLVMAIAHGPRGLPAAWEFAATLLTLAGVAWIVGEMARAVSELRLAKRLATEDPLTEVLNPRGLSLALPRELARCTRAGAPLSVVFLDLDHFKDINDKLGHQKGDRVLKLVASTICTALRTEDIFARVGGDEFVILLPCTQECEAATAAERVRRAIADDMAREGWPVTASVGVVTWHQPGGPTDAIIKRADEAMYAAKRSGGNCVCHLSVATKGLPTLAEADQIIRSIARYGPPPQLRRPRN